jgi:hypothetical protein
MSQAQVVAVEVVLYKRFFNVTGRIQMDRLTVFCDLADVRRMGKILKLNDHTVWVKIMKGAKSAFVIKRHIKKHNCFFFTKGGYHIDETIYTKARDQDTIDKAVDLWLALRRSKQKPVGSHVYPTENAGLPKQV